MEQENWGKPDNGGEEEIVSSKQNEQLGEGAPARIEDVQSGLDEISAKAKAQVDKPDLSPEKKQTMLDMIDQKTEAVLRFAVAFIATHPNVTLAAISLASFYCLNDVTGPNVIHTESSRWVAENADFGISGGLVNEHSAGEIQSARDIFYSNVFVAVASGLTAVVGTAKWGFDVAKGGFGAASDGIANIRKSL